MHPPLLALALTAAASAQGVTLEVTVSAGDVPREGSPAAGTFAWPAALAEPLTVTESDHPVPWTASLVDAATEAALPCEVLAELPREERPAVGTLRLIVDGLPAGGQRRCRLVLGKAPASAGSLFTASTGDAMRELQQDGQAVLRHEFPFDRQDLDRTSKPIWHLLLPGTPTVLTKGTGGRYPHHRGLFLGWNRTQVADAVFDFWHCDGPAQRHTGYHLGREAHSAVRGDLASGAHWLSPLDEPLVRDRRVLTVWRRQADAAKATMLLDVAIELSADQLVALRGDPHHAGFHLRVADEVAEREDARYVRPAAAQGGDDDLWTDCPWVAGLFTIEGRRVAIQHMSHPDNPQPTTYSTRAYGRFGAHFTADITPGQPLRLRYRLLVEPLAAEEAPDPDRFARAYADFANPVAVTITGT
jgi:hypothetical protein